MYDTEQNEQNRRREQSLYRAAFAGVHASESLKREDFYMKKIIINRQGCGSDVWRSPACCLQHFCA